MFKLINLSERDHENASLLKKYERVIKGFFKRRSKRYYQVIIIKL